ncbi:hypothetical protein Ddye_020639 [Dipteronia dyeriana]|uniref:Uncharacterized protein n=1 Tax=Dipteronia dyeriana TaxID=168575 RepID=A0AAD9U033_9ROSI|nr:hypothetical protein Ddye_020639 [Dipteronia dyeriana]
MAAQYNKEDLIKAGLVGFAMVDEMNGRRARISPPSAPHFHHHHHHNRHDHHDQQQSYVYHGPQVVTVREAVIDSNQAAQLYGGTVIIEYSKGKPTGWAL